LSPCQGSQNKYSSFGAVSAQGGIATRIPPPWVAPLRANPKERALKRFCDRFRAHGIKACNGIFPFNGPPRPSPLHRESLSERWPFRVSSVLFESQFKPFSRDKR